jgi:hypothetical protein
MAALNQQDLARRLDVTDRNIRLLEDRGVIVRLPSREYDLSENLERYRLFRDRDLNAVADRIEDTAQEVDDLVIALEAEPDIEVRRTIMHERGGAVGRFMGWMKLANAMRPEAERDLLEVVTNTISAKPLAGSFICASGNWQTRMRRRRERLRTVRSHPVKFTSATWVETWVPYDHPRADRPNEVGKRFRP